MVRQIYLRRAPQRSRQCTYVVCPNIRIRSPAFAYCKIGTQPAGGSANRGWRNSSGRSLRDALAGLCRGLFGITLFSGRSLRRKASLDAGLRGAEASARPAQRTGIYIRCSSSSRIAKSGRSLRSAANRSERASAGGGCGPRAPEAPNSLETFGLLQVRNFGPRAPAEPDSLKTVAPLARERACGPHLPGATAQRSAPDIRSTFSKSDPPLSASQPGTRPYSFRAIEPAARPSHFRPRRAPR